MGSFIQSTRRALCAAFVLVTVAWAEATPAENAEADRVLDRWVEAVGGAKKLKAIWRSEYKMQRASVQHGITDGKITESQTVAFASGPFRTVFQLPNGEFEAADDGRNGWVYHAGLGGQVLDPRRAERERRDTGPAEALRVRESFPVRRLLPDVEFNSKMAHVVELTDRHGWRERWHFDVTTGLRIRRERPDEDNGPVSIDYSDFRKVNGVIEPFRYGSLWANGFGQVVEVQTAAHRLRSGKATPEWQIPPGLEADSHRVEEALRRLEQALGDKEATKNITSRVTKSHVEISTNGISYDVVTTQKSPGRILVEQDIPGVGPMMQGFDGKIGWAWSEMQGYRELKGAELIQIATMSSLTPRSLSDDAPLRRIVREENGPDGHHLLVVNLANIAGNIGVFYFDVETGLLAKVETVVQAGPGGMMKVEMNLSDYREVDGVTLAFAQEVINPAVRMLTKVLTVKHNVDLPDEMFLPRKKGEMPSAPAKATDDAKQVPVPSEVPTPAGAPAEAPAK